MAQNLKTLHLGSGHAFLVLLPSFEHMIQDPAGTFNYFRRM